MNQRRFFDIVAFFLCVAVPLWFLSTLQPNETVLIALVLAAAWADLKTRHIPNWIPVSGAVCGMIFQVWHSGLSGALDCIAGAALGMAIFLPLYILGGMGAGDVKLFTAVGILVGPQALVLVFVLTGLLGGFAAGILALWRGCLRQTLSKTGDLMMELGRMHWQEARAAATEAGPETLRLPYGAVIAGGTLLSLIARH
jgi:prepilin peptidase CpaA